MAGTESFSPRYRGLDAWDNAEILEAIWEGQARAVAAVRPALAAIASAARAIAERIEPDGRLIYVGAGSSGRQAALDGMELGATFGWPAHRVAFVLAEGLTLDPAVKATDEDDGEEALRQIGALAPRGTDALIAVAASGATPFTLTAAKAARSAGALVVAIANNAEAPLFRHATHPVLLQSGAEAIAGSTRLNAGTAQKAALGMLSTLLMTRLGHIHDGLMVSMRPDCAKLERRAARIVADIAGCADDAAWQALEACGGRIKPAVLVARGVAPEEAGRLLSEAGGNLRIALGRLSCSD